MGLTLGIRTRSHSKSMTFVFMVWQNVSQVDRRRRKTVADSKQAQTMRHVFKRTRNIFSIFLSGKGDSPLLPERPVGCCATKRGLSPFPLPCQTPFAGTARRVGLPKAKGACPPFPFCALLRSCCSSFAMSHTRAFYNMLQTISHAIQQPKGVNLLSRPTHATGGNDCMPSALSRVPTVCRRNSRPTLSRCIGKPCELCPACRRGGKPVALRHGLERR